MRDLQSSIDSGGDYGSPHLTHPSLTRLIEGELSALTAEGSWLDIGAGHGRFLRIPLQNGMRTVATEMSARARASMADRYRSQPALEVRAATDTDSGVRETEQFAVISMISVIHHIPDYTEAIAELVDGHLEPGGSFVCFQDPLFYPRLGRPTDLFARASYYSWRVTQGGVRRGLSTLKRRLLKQYDATNPSDMVEYHVVRQGVDEERLLALLTPRFEQVRLIRYWSSQGRFQQWLGAKLGMTNTFGIVALNRFPREG